MKVLDKMINRNQQYIKSAISNYLSLTMHTNLCVIELPTKEFDGAGLINLEEIPNDTDGEFSLLLKLRNGEKLGDCVE